MPDAQLPVLPTAATKVRGFMMEPSDLREIGTILSTHIATKQDLLIACELLTTISVDGMDIRLEKGLLQRLRTRCYGSKPFPEFLREVVLKGLHEYVGW